MADISRADVASLIGEAYSPEVITAAVNGSVVLEAFDKVDMGTKITHMPVLATLPEAAWVTESATDPGGVKPTAEATWGDKTLVAEEVAVIVPVHENVVDDASADVLGSLAAIGGAALGKKVDQAVIFGTQKPASWTSAALVPAAVAAGHVFEVDPAGGADDLFGSIMQAAEAVADEDLDPTTLLARVGLRFALANARGSDGHLLLNSDATMLSALETHWSRNGAWNSAAALAVVADKSCVRIGVRQDVTVKFLDQATVGGINLAERDMVALRFKARFAYVLGTPAGKQPVAAVTPAA